MINEIILRRRNKMTIPTEIQSENTHNDHLVVAMMKNIQNLGFTFDEEVFYLLSCVNRNNLRNIYNELIPKLKKMKGADVEYHPMYPNFPRQVIEASDVELFVNAIIHYWSCGTLLPEYQKEERFPLIDDPDLTVLHLGDEKDEWEIFQNLLSSKTSISEQDKKDIKTIVRNHVDFYDYLPEEIPLKENVAFLCNLIINDADFFETRAIQKYFKTATDVLRLVTAMSDGDVSLAEDTKFRSMKRSERRMIMDLLEGCGSIQEDMFKYRNRWIRIGEIIHPREEYWRGYNKTKNAFQALRKGDKPLFFDGKVQDSILKGEIKEAATMLKLRPGQFARQLDKLLRDVGNDTNFVINSFASVADKVAVPVLLSVREHFMNRNDGSPVRVIIPKGLTANTWTIPQPEKPIDEKVCKTIVGICEQAIVKINTNKEYMGNVYIDDGFKSYNAPFSMRSANTATKTLVRGSRVKVGDKANIIRGFIWWTNCKGDDYYDVVDIDLAASFYDEKWGYLQRCSWTELRSDKFKTYHSGDITNGGAFDGKGVAEFIDFDINSAQDARYLVFTIHSYTQQKFADIEHLRFGWMEREDMDSGEIFEPSTVEMSMDINSNSTIAVPVIFDLKTREMIWCDFATDTYPRAFNGNSIEANLEGVIATCYAAACIKKTNLYDLIDLNVRARGNIVQNRYDADIIFSNDTTKPTKVHTDENGEVITETKDTPIYTVYDLDYYMNEMM